MSSIQTARLNTSGLLAADEPPPYHAENMACERPVLIVCDHANNRIPRALGTLGLGLPHLEQHIAWDLGAAQVAGRLGQLLQAQVIYSGYSRLVVDVNRNGIEGGAIPALSDGILVPGNLGLSDSDIQQRMTGLFDPYHEAIARTLSGMIRGTTVPVLISIHSFTPYLHGLFRPWDIGVLWDKDPRIAIPLLGALRQHTELAIGDNLPYSGQHPADYTVDRHGEAAGFAHVGIEVRQDLIAGEDGQDRFARLLADGLADVLARDDVYCRRNHTQLAMP